MRDSISQRSCRIGNFRDANAQSKSCVSCFNSLDHDSGLFWYPPVIPSPWSMANVIGKCGRLLLHSRANQSCVNRHGATPLLLAAEAGHREVISTLLQGVSRRGIVTFRRYTLSSNGWCTWGETRIPVKPVRKKISNEYPICQSSFLSLAKLDRRRFYCRCTKSENGNSFTSGSRRRPGSLGVPRSWKFGGVCLAESSMVST